MVRVPDHTSYFLGSILRVVRIDATPVHWQYPVWVYGWRGTHDWFHWNWVWVSCWVIAIGSVRLGLVLAYRC